MAKLDSTEIYGKLTVNTDLEVKNNISAVGTLELGQYSTTENGQIILNSYNVDRQSIIKCTDGNLHIDSEATHSLYLNYYTGTGGIKFGNGAGGYNANVSSSGVITATSFTGANVTSGVDPGHTHSIYTGNTGDITGVTAGTGISGGGTSGTVTITNSAPNIVQTTVTGSSGSCTGNAGSSTKVYVNAYDGTTLMKVLGSHDGSNSYGNVYKTDAIYMNMSTNAMYATRFYGAVTGTVTGSSTSCTGNAASATKLATARTIDITGDITATAVSFNGTANIAISAAVNDDSHRHTGLYRSDTAIDNYNVKSHWGGIISGYWGLRGYNSTTYHAPVAVGYASTSAACSGNAATATSATSATTASKLTINSSTSASLYNMLWNSGTTVYGEAGMRVQPSTDSLFASGNITAYYSDERLKEKTGSIENALDKVLSLDAFLYVENALAKSLGYNNSQSQIGLSAQQVQAILPEIVSLAPVDTDMDKDGNLVSKSGENYLTVDYAKVTPLLVAAIQEQQSTIESQQNDIDELKAQMKILMSR